jgi:hypothetical protein
MEDKKFIKNRSTPTVAPGMDDDKFGEAASAEDMKKGNFTKVTRVYLDENDPS